MVERRFFVFITAMLLVILAGAAWAAPVTDNDVAYIKAKLESGQMLTDSDIALIEQINTTTSNYYDINAALERAKMIADGERQESQPVPAARTRGTLDEYAWATTNYEWIDISETGTAVAPGDDSSYGPFNLGFTFTFYDQPFTQIRFCSNGFLNFGTSSTSLSNTSIPNTLTPNNAIYPFWDDLDAGTTTLPTGQIKYYADADNQRFIVSWLAVPHYYTNGSNTYNYTFQCVLYANGNILFQYQNIQQDTLPGDTSCTVGIENGTGTQALQICFNGTGTLPTSNTAFLINQPTGIPTNVTNLQGQASGMNVTLTWQDPTVDTYGNPMTPDNIEVWLSAIGAPGTLLGTVGAGAQSYTYTAPSSGNYLFWVRAQNDGYYSPGVSVAVIVGTPSYNEDFEADNGGWTPTGTLWQWGAPVVPAGGHAPHSGSNCWGTNLAGNYPASSCDHLQLAPNLTVASPSATIEFWYWVDTELSYDGANLKVSVDNGATWTLVTPNGGYPRASLSSSNVCIPSQPAWAGRDSTWRYTVLPIGQYIGQTPIFRISFGSDPSIHYRGFMLDDMMIWGLQSPAGVPAAPTNLTGNYTAPNVVLTWTDPTVDLLGSPVILTNLEVWLGPAVTGTLLGTVMPGTQTYTHVNPPFGHLTYSVRGFANAAYGPSAVVPITAGTPTYLEDFETSNGMWVPSPETGGWAWGAPVVPVGGHAPHSGTNCWGTVLTGPYTVSACWYLDLDLGLVVNSPSATFEFWYWVDTELSYDGVNLKVSVDDGTTWTLVTPNEGYPRASLSTANVCMASQPAWAGRDSTWRRTVLPLNQFQGQSPIFRLTFGSDPSVQYRGFFFDDVEIWGLAMPTMTPVSGRVSLDGIGGTITNATVRSNGVGNPETHPLADSTYSISVQSGERRLIASLTGYHNDTLTVTVAQTPVTNQNFVLRRLNPVAPTGFTVSVNIANGIVTLNWDDSPDVQVDRYKVYRKLRNDANWVFRKEVVGRTNSGTTDTLTVGGIYQYRITALDYDVVPPAVESDPSSTAELAYGALPPHSLVADTAYDNRIVLSWLDPLALPEAELFYDGGTNHVQGIGFWNATTPLQFGWLVTKYTRPTSTTIMRIKHYFTDAARAGDVYQVGVFADSTNGRPSLVVQGLVETNIPGAGQWHIVTLTTPVTIPSGVFYIGARQMAAAPPSICIGGDTVTAFQNSTYYYCGTSTSGWSSYEPNLMATPMQRCIVRTAAGQEIELSPDGPLAPVAIRHSVPTGFKTGEKFERRLVTDEPELNTDVKSETILPADMPSVKLVLTEADKPVRRYLPYAVAHMPKQMPFVLNERGNRTLDDVTRYIIYRNGTRRDSVAGTVTTYSDVVGSANENVAYTYTVTARYDNGQESAASNSITARCGMAPGQPTNGSLTRVGETSVRIQWTDPTVNADGTPCTDLANVRLYRDGLFVTNVNPGVGQYLDQGLTPATRYEWMLVTVDEVPLSGEPYLLNGVAGNPSYDASFETDNGGWVATPTTGGWEWGAPTAANGPTPHSGNNVWGTVLGGPYVNGACWQLDLNLGLEVQSPSARVEFFAWYWTERTFDGVNFKVSVDNGQTWTVVAPDQGYPLASLSATWNRCGTGTQPAWSGDSSEAWSFWTIPLNLFVDQTPIFRFDFTSDSLSVTNPGFYIDDLTIWGLSPASGVTGTVRKFGTTTPLENTTVAVTGIASTTTDAQGHYRLGLDPGTYTVVYSHPHHCDSTVTGVVVVDGQETVRDMFLKAPTASFSVTSLSFIAGQNATRSDSFQITNNGQCPLQFAITDTSAWLSATPANGTVQVGSPVWITVRATTGTRPAGDYNSRLFIAYNAVGTPYSMRVDLDIDLTVDPLAALPTEFAYHQNYPNPFNATTALRFDVPQQSQVQIAIFNVMGQEVARPVDGVYVAGRHQVLFDAGELPSGMYMVKMTAGSFTTNSKMLLLK